MRDNWNYYDLLEVYELFVTCKNQIHQNNPAIIKLAKKLNKKIRGVENQLLMFRAVEKEIQENHLYGRKNYNKLVKVIYMEKNKLTISMDNNKIYPYKFKKFEKTNDSSVSKSDDPNSGRPFGKMLRIGIHDFVDKVINLNKNNNEKRILFFIGGPGNGKTDTSQYVFNQMQEANCMDSSQKSLYLSHYNHGFTTNQGYYSKIRYTNNKSFYCIQDATVKMTQNQSNFDSFCQVFNEFKGEQNGLLVVCINRGIIETFLKTLNDPTNIIYKILQQSNNCTSVNAYFNNTDNLDISVSEFKISAYPLDKASLFSKKSTVHNDIQELLIAEPWDESIISFNRDNFIATHNHFGELIFAHELKNNKKVTFREYFNFLHFIFYPSTLSLKSIKDTPNIRLWQTESIENIQTIKNKINSLKYKNNSELNNLIDDLITVEKYRSSSTLSLKLQELNPRKRDDKWDTEDLYKLIVRLRDNPNLSSNELKFSIFKGIEIDRSQSSKINNTDLHNIKHFIDIYSSLEQNDKDGKTKELETIKKFILRLLRNYMCIVNFSIDGEFKYKEEFEQFVELREDSINQTRETLLKALKIKKEDDDYYIMKVALNNSLWEYEFSENNSIEGEVELNQPLRITKIDSGNKPELNMCLFETQVNEEIIYTYLDFNTFLKLIELKDVFDTNLKRLSATVNPSIKLWLNSEKEKLVNRNFDRINELQISNIGIIKVNESGNIRIQKQ